MSTSDRLRCDVLVIGSGIAGLTFALEAAKWADVIVVSKRAASEANTKYAQGGISAVLSPDDSFDEHVKDTLVAGAGLCREEAVRAIVSEAPERIRALQALGVHFDARHDDAGNTFESGELDLGREGGHSKRRVVHAGDIT
ncbi:MAG: FAD-dependent oxidoreductase, partial [Polyangiales bacterium]